MDYKLEGVILAAGKGARIYPLSNNIPKPIFPILNKPLIEYQIITMASIGIKKVIVVIGWYGFKIVQALGDGSRFGVSIEYVEQEVTDGIASAVGKLESRIDSHFLLFLGDIFFRTKDLRPMCEGVLSGKYDTVLAVKRDVPEAVARNFAVIENSDGLVKKVIEKPRRSSTNLKGCGLYLFDVSIFDAIRQTPRTAMRDEYEITNSIQILIDMEYKVKAMDVIEEDLNLTEPKDILDINLRELDRSGQNNCIADDVVVSTDARIERSVIGDHAWIHPTAEIHNSLVFSEGQVLENQILESCIVIDDKIIRL